MFDLSTYLWCAVGIIISVLLPILWEAVWRAFPKPKSGGPESSERINAFWQVVRPYLLLGAASLVTALLIVAFVGDQLHDFRAAILAGYAWDSTLQKLRR